MTTSRYGPDTAGARPSQDKIDAAAMYARLRGIRIEDDALVTDSGAEVLTAGVPKSADDVEAAIGG